MWTCKHKEVRYASRIKAETLLVNDYEKHKWAVFVFASHPHLDHDVILAEILGIDDSLSEHDRIEGIVAGHYPLVEWQ